MQGHSVDMWYFKISIAQDNLVCILLGSVARLWFEDISGFLAICLGYSISSKSLFTEI
jgi:hypothetical protein